MVWCVVLLFVCLFDRVLACFIFFFGVYACLFVCFVCLIAWLCVCLGVCFIVCLFA